MRTALLINADGTIGRAACRTLVENKWRVIATCLSEATASCELDVTLLSGEDIGSPSFSSRVSTRLIGELRPPIVDLLVFNCEPSYEHPWGLPQMKFVPDEHQANARRVKKVVLDLAPHVRPGGRVIVIAGCVACVSPRQHGLASTYRVSSVAARTVDEHLRPEFAERRVSVECVMPKLTFDRRYGGSAEICGAAVGLPMCRAELAAVGLKQISTDECVGFDAVQEEAVGWR